MKKQIITTLLIILLAVPSFSQKKNENTPSKTTIGYNFTPVVQLKATSVKNQANTGTCWCFATTSFIESELMRMGKGEYDLSEMWIVRYNYIDKLNDNFVQQGKGNLGEGSLAHDWMIEFTKHGMVPNEVYTGLNYSMPNHFHGEMNAFLKAVAKVPVDRKKESDQYTGIVNDILDTYLGKVPETFTYNGVGYTPQSFAKSLGINPSDYVEITSFTHFPFYTVGPVPVPDNWRKVEMYNVPLDELIKIMDNSLNTGYTVDWDGDVSEKGFSHRNGVAIIPEVQRTEAYNASDKKKYGPMTVEDRTAEAYRFSQPFPEMNITQEYRQKGFEDESTTDDHLMHVTGLVKDQNGTKYYITKNSWGTESNSTGGYLNMSESYVKAKTIFIMVHKDAVPADIRKKLGF
ncbi:MAG TPA: C1 family peptidase [Bacteroidales bacterium]|nr:C1 family peptidase [Bacteroidales bacterium]